MFRIVPHIHESSQPDMVTCVHCKRDLNKKKDQIIWTSQGVKTPACKPCHDEQKRKS